MRIVHLSTSDQAGGAARAAYRLHTGLKRLGHESTMVVANRVGFDSDVKWFKPSAPDWKSRVSRRWRAMRIRRDRARYAATAPPGHEMFSDDRTESAGEFVRLIPPCDVINLHWVAGLLDYESFFARLPHDVPLVWRLADMNPFTGGCHYNAGCDKFTAQCGGCPQLGSPDPHDLSRQVWLRKRQSLGRPGASGLQLVATSRWIAGEAKRSALFGGLPVTVIPNGLDVADFAPRDRNFSRDTLGVPRDAKVVLFVADSADNRRKGFAELAAAVEGMNGAGGSSQVENLFLLSVGVGRPHLKAPVPHLHLGKISNDRLLSAVYSAADLYVIASLQESFGQTVIESLACGTPVAGFASGGIPDMVRPGVTGDLAPTGDVAALRAVIVKTLNDPAARSVMAANCRRVAVEEYSLETQARNYERFYQTLLKREARGAPAPANDARPPYEAADAIGGPHGAPVTPVPGID